MKREDLTSAKKAALKRVLDPANNVTFPIDWKLSREEIYDEAVLRHAVARKLWGKE